MGYDHIAPGGTPRWAGVPHGARLESLKRHRFETISGKSEFSELLFFLIRSSGVIGVSPPSLLLLRVLLLSLGSLVPLVPGLPRFFNIVLFSACWCPHTLRPFVYMLIFRTPIGSYCSRLPNLLTR